MTKKLKELIERAESWPQALQEEVLESVASIERGYAGSYRLTADDMNALSRSAEDVREDKFVSDEVLAEFFRKNRLA